MKIIGINWEQNSTAALLIDGKIVRSGNMDLAHEIEQKGYSWLEK